MTSKTVKLLNLVTSVLSIRSRMNANTFLDLWA